jgi:beta-glucosidase
VGFQKVTLEPGQKTTVAITIDPAASHHPLGYWDGREQRWVVAEGEHTILVGTSSRDLPLRGEVTVRAASVRQ